MRTGIFLKPRSQALRQDWRKWNSSSCQFSTNSLLFTNRDDVVLEVDVNGAGKTSFAQRLLPDSVNCREYVNADLIAAGLSPFAPESQALYASELMLARIRQLVKGQESFAFETTLSGRSYSQMIPAWRDAGFGVSLLFLWLPSADMAVRRVATRVRQGGHDIPEYDIRRRYRRGIKNLFELYLPCVDSARVYNSSALTPRLIWKQDDGFESVLDETVWKAVMLSAKGDAYDR